MFTEQQQSPKLAPIEPLAGALATSIGYAFLLNTKEGLRWDRQHTWFVVMVGVLYTLGWLAVHDPKAALKALLFFVASGLPLIVRALIINNQEIDSITNRKN